MATIILDKSGRKKGKVVARMRFSLYNKKGVFLKRYRMDENKNKFVRETIKDKPINKKRVWIKFVIAAGCAIVFAVIFCAITALVLPLLLAKRGLKISDAGTENETEIATEVEVTEEPETETETETPVVVDDPLTIEDYQELQTQLYNIGQTANKSVVVITSVSSDTDWFNDSYESAGEGCGVIISENAKQFYILTEQKLIHEASSVQVTFIDDSTVEATVVGSDENIGLAVISVLKENMQDTTLSRVAVATTGDSNVVNPGTVVIALGSPLGSAYSVLSGTITATDLKASTVDHNFSLFSTDIVSNSSGTGILINTEGEMVAVIMQSLSADENTITAVSISNLENIIDLLKAGKKIPSLGLSISTVTSKIANEYDLPMGVYIKSVEMDSLAANAGLQVGDVITEMNGEDITSDDAYSEALLSLKSQDSITLVVKRKGANGYTELSYEITIGEK